MAAAPALAFSLNNSLNSHLLLAPSVSINPLVIPRISTVSSSSAKKTHHSKLKHSPKASSEGVPSELNEDSKFVPLNADDPIYGPPALLFLGFEVEEAGKIQQFLKDLDAEFLKIAKGLPRICFLSGLSGEEMMAFIDSFPEAGLGLPVFAALVPNSANKLLEELIEEIMEDNEVLTPKGKEMA